MQNHANKPNIQIEIAPAGYYVLEIGNDENGAPFNIIKHPVIAWKFDLAEPDYFLIPSAITLQGDAENDDLLRNAPVLSPCGLVRLGTMEIWGSEDDYLQTTKEDYQAREEERQQQRGQA